MTNLKQHHKDKWSPPHPPKCRKYYETLQMVLCCSPDRSISRYCWVVILFSPRQQRLWEIMSRICISTTSGWPQALQHSSRSIIPGIMSYSSLFNHSVHFKIGPVLQLLIYSSISQAPRHRAQNTTYSPHWAMMEELAYEGLTPTIFRNGCYGKSSDPVWSDTTFET